MNPDTKLRIALVPPLWATVAPGTAGGVEYIVYLLAQELSARGHEVTVFTSRDSATTASVESLVETNLIEAMEKGFAWEYEYYETCNIAQALQKSRSFDVIHFHVGAYAIPLGELSAAPVIHTLHNPVTPDTIWLLNRYAKVLVTAVSYTQIAGIPQERRLGIRVIHNACDFDAYELCEWPGKYLAFLGRMGPGKGPYDAIQIAREAGLPIVLAGQPLDDEERGYFSTTIQPLIDHGNVIYIGPVDHGRKVELLKGAAALLFPIQAEETFGMVMIEAMACGTPVVAFRLGAVPEVIDSGRTGFHSDQMEALPALVWNALALDRKAVWQHAKQRFSLTRMVDQYLQAYSAILDGSHGHGSFLSERAS